MPSTWCKKFYRLIGNQEIGDVKKVSPVILTLIENVA
jgi:hypothetical protein